MIFPLNLAKVAGLANGAGGVIEDIILGGHGAKNDDNEQCPM